MSDLIRKSDALAAAKGFIGAETAIAALPAVTPKVKPLVWVKDGEAWSAKTPVGEYRLAKVHGDWMWFFAWLPESTTDKIDKGYGKSKADASTAAQADYEARILAALTTEKSHE